MKITASQAFKFLTSKIHPPLPRTPRESEQLLSILTSSFRRQLDREHPPVQAEKVQSLKKERSGKYRRPGDADQHLSSILNHPLFSTVPHQSSPSPSHNAGPSSTIPTEGPVQALDRAIASGIADFRVVYNCLDWHRGQLADLPPKEMRVRMGESKIGLKVESWLASTDTQSKRDFFRHRPTVDLVMLYMVSGRQRRTVLRWLEDIRRETPCTPEFRKAFSFSPQFIVLESYVMAECVRGDGIVTALRTFMKACYPSRSKTPNSLPPYMLSIASLLARRICQLPEAQSKSIPTQLFDDFSLIFEATGNPALQVRKYFWKAKLGLHHPNQPNADFSLKHAEMVCRSSHQNLPQNWKAFLNLYFEAAQLYTKQGNFSQARKIMEVAKHLLPEENSPSDPGPRFEREGQFPALSHDIHDGLLPT